jgi:hypothetical protein
MARANGFRNALRDQAPAQPILLLRPQSPLVFGLSPQRLDRAVTWSAPPAPSVLRFSNLGSFGQMAGQSPAQASRRNNKPGAVSRPGMIAYSWIVRFLYEIRVTRVEVKNAECGQVARPRVRPPCGRRYADALPPDLMIERRKIYRPRSAVRPQPSDSRNWPSSPPPTC